MKVLLFFFLLMGFRLEAQQLQCSKNGTVIFYINGVANSESDFQLSLNRLTGLFNDQEFKVRTDSKSVVNVDGQYNQTETAKADIIEAVRQRADEIFGNRRAAKKIALLLFDQGNTNDKIMNNKALEVYRDSVLETPRETDLFHMTSSIMAHLDAKKKVLVVSHSQGNLFANENYVAVTELLTVQDKLKLRDVLGNLQVASPTSPANGRSRFFKLTNDGVTGNLGGTGNYETPLMLASDGVTQIHEIAPDDLLNNHGFLSVYLATNLTAKPTNSSLAPYDKMSSIFKNEIHETALKLADNCQQFEISGPDSLVKTAKGDAPLEFTYFVPASFFVERGIDQSKVIYQWKRSNSNIAPVVSTEPSFTVSTIAFSNFPDSPSLSSGTIFVYLKLLHSETGLSLGENFKISTWSCQGEGCCQNNYRYVDTSHELGHQCISPPGARMSGCGSSIFLTWGGPGAPDQWPVSKLILPDGSELELSSSGMGNFGVVAPPTEGASTWGLKLEVKDYWGGEATATCTYFSDAPAVYEETNSVTNPPAP